MAVLQHVAKALYELLLDLYWRIHLQRLLSLPKHIEQVQGIRALQTPGVILQSAESAITQPLVWTCITRLPESTSPTQSKS